MANQDVEITTAIIAGENFITVDREGVVLTKGELLEFQNSLSYTNNGGNQVTVDARLTFYPFLTKNAKKVPQAIEGFCTQEPKEKVFNVAAGDTSVCTPAKDGNFIYSITAAQHHPLDPVVIVDLPGGGFTPFLFSIFGAGLGMAILYVGTKWAYSRGLSEGRA